MVCPRCTLLHPVGTTVCGRCGTRLRGQVEALSTLAIDNAPTSIGMVSGISLLTCLAVALAVPAAASVALSFGAYFGLISISNIWLTVYRGQRDELLRGLRGMAYSGALLVSLVGEIARLQHVQTIAIPGIIDLPVPSAIATELLAALLIVLDPLVIRPLIQWIEDGVEHGEPEG